MPKTTITSLLIGSTLMIGNHVMAAPVHGPFDAPLADEVKVLEMLKKSGRIPTLASPEQEQAALASYYREKSRAYQGNSGTLAVKEGKVRETGSSQQIFTSPKDPYTKQLMAAALELRTTHT